MKNYNKISVLRKRFVSTALVIALIAPITNVSFAYDILDTNVKNTMNATNKENEVDGELETPRKGEESKEESETPEEGILFKDAFDDVNFKKYIKEKILKEPKLNENEFVITSDTFSKTTTIWLNDDYIKSLKGIEYFQNLTTLISSKNPLKTLDLSKNTKLEGVSIYDTTDLYKLDLSKNTNLKTINCISNYISEVALPQNVILDSLNLSNNKLSNLNLNGITQVNELDCSYNKLASLDLSNLNIKKLVCSKNYLTKLDLSNNLNLTSLECYGNNLSNIDLSQCTNLIKGNIGLQQTEYELTTHNGQYSINIGKDVNNEKVKSSVEVSNPQYAQYTSDGYIDLGNTMVLINGYALYKVNYSRTYVINGKSFDFSVSAKIKGKKEPEEPKPEEPKPEEEKTKTEFLNGTDRYDTSIKISKNGFYSADNVVLVNDSSLPDALSVTPYAKVKNAPILLTKSNELNTKTRNEIERLNAKNIYIIGGENSVNKSVEKELMDIGYRVERISGEDRYITSLNIAKELNKYINIKEAVVVNGSKGIPDAVSVAGISAQKGMPVLLTSETDNMNNITSFINTTGVSKNYIVGGTNLFPTDISKKIPSPVNIYGSDRNETNTKVINNFYTQSELNNTYVCKNGMLRQDDLIDALSVGVLSAKNQSPVMLVGNSLYSSQNKLVKNKKIKVITQVGGDGNENAFNELKYLLK